MAWIESHQEIAQHPKTKRLARYLGVSIPDAIGRLHLLWWWATNYAADGDIGNFDAEDLADATLWEGEPDILCNALKRAGFIDDDDQLHDWDQYHGRLMESRKLSNARHVRNQQLYNDYELLNGVRKRDGSACRYCGVDVVWRDRKSPRGGTYDHVDPEGPNTVDNIVVSCRGCNAGKGRRSPQQARMTLLPPPSQQISTVDLPESTGDGRSDLLLQNTTGPNLTLPDQTKPTGEATTTPVAPSPRRGGGSGGVPSVELSIESRDVLDAWRLAQGLRSPPRLNPTQAAALEEAVADLGSERLKAACTWAAGEGITVLTKAIRGAKTKRQREEQGINGSNGHGENRQHPGRPGPGSGRANAGPGAGGAGEDDPFAKYVRSDANPNGLAGSP